MKKIVLKKVSVLMLLYFIIVMGVLMVTNRMKALNNNQNSYNYSVLNK